MKNKFSFSAYLIALMVLIFTLFHYHRWTDIIIIDGDAHGYYVYLPAVIVHDDLLTFERTYAAREAQKGNLNPTGKAFLNTKPLPNGHILDKYTCGAAIMASPFYWVAHQLAAPLGYARDGFSEIYRFSFFLAGFCYVMWGVFILRRILLRYFDDVSVAITLLVMLLGTNLYYFTAYECVMSHSFLFFLYVLLMNETIIFHERVNWKSALLIGLCAGGITAIRPTEGIVLLIPFVYGVYNKTTFFEKIHFLRQNIKYIAGAILSFIAAGVPQLLYWKACTGQYFYYSYEEEGFDFKHPHIIGGLFYFQNGWLAYSPIMALALVGLYFLRFDTKWKLVILLLLPLHIYIIYSWWCWYYINGVGSRPMVEVYPLLALGMTAFWQTIWRKTILRFIAVSFGMLSIMLFTSLVWQINKGLFIPDFANRFFYFHMIGKTKMDWRGATMYDTNDWQPDTTDLKLTKTLITKDFEDSLSQEYVRKPFKGKFACRVSKEKEFFNIMNEDFDKNTLKAANYLKAEVHFMREYTGQDILKNSLLVVEWNDENGKKLKSRNIRLDNKTSRSGDATLWGWEPFVWTKAYFFFKLNRTIPDKSNIKVYIKNVTENPIFIDETKVELYE